LTTRDGVGPLVWAAHHNGAQSVGWSLGISAPDPEFYLVERPIV
jgi:hypothetical protein